MQFKFVTREAYRNIQSELFLDALKQEFGPFYFLPEGGTNSFAVKGCEEILTPDDTHFDYVCCSVGTGGTLAGLINCSKPGQQVLGFPALKGDFLKEEISKFVTKSNWKLITDYHFGGYAKINLDLISFINDFKSKYNIPLDPIYTGKLVYGVFDLMKKGYFPKEAKILIIHTGGLQGIAGMNTVLQRKDMPLIQL
jgi:1-aminocyclopropane-1-carboxylate deaminase